MTDIHQERLREVLDNAVPVHEVDTDWWLIHAAARAHADCLANGERVEPDYEAAMGVALELGVRTSMLKLEAIVQAALGGSVVLIPIADTRRTEEKT